MPPYGHSPDAAGKAAVRRDCEQFILVGFSRQWQYDICFNTIPFGATWLRRMYTNEKTAHILRARSEEARQAVRYGNNIGVLFKACHYLRHAYPSHDFWSAIARGFGSSSDAVKDMVSVFEKARIDFCHDNPGADDDRTGDRTGANREVDLWLDVSRDLKDLSTRRNRTYPDVYDDALKFFKGQEGRYVDLGRVLPKPGNYQQYSPSSRKRSASPSSVGRSRSPKRRQSSTYHDRADLCPPQPQQPLASLATGLQIKGSATKQEYHAPVSTSEQITTGNPFFRDPADPSELAQKVFGAAQKDRNGSPSIGMLNNTVHRMSSGNSSDDDKYQPEHRLDLTDKDLARIVSLLDQTLAGGLTTKMLALEKTVAHAAPESAIATMQARITSLVQKVNSVEEANRALKEQLAEMENTQRSLNTSLETTNERLTRLGPNKALASSVSSGQDLETRVACLEDHPLMKTSDTAQVDQTNHREACPYAQSLEERIRKMEARPNEGIQLGEIKGKVATTENRLDRLESQAEANKKRDYASKGFIEEKLKQVESRHSRDIEAAAKQKHMVRLQEQIKNLQDQFTNREIETSRLTKAVDMLSTPKSPPPMETSASSLDEMAAKVAALSKAKSEKVFQLEEGLRNEIEDHQKRIDQKLETSGKDINESIVAVKRSVDDLAKKTGNLPSISSLNAHISERLSKIESTLRADVESGHRDMNTRIEKFGKDLDTLTTQFKGLNKMWNKAMADVNKAGSVVSDMDATKVEVASLSKKVSNFANQGIGMKLETFHTQLRELHSQVTNGTSSGFSPANLSARLDEQKREIDGLKSSTEALGDIPDLDARITGVARIVESLIQHLET